MGREASEDPVVRHVRAALGWGVRTQEREMGEGVTVRWREVKRGG